MAVGDDVYVGDRAGQLDEFSQIILKNVDGSCLTVLTPSEVIEIPLTGEKVDSGLMGVQMCAQAAPEHLGPDAVTLGFEAPYQVRILRGRVYRRELE